MKKDSKVVKNKKNSGVLYIRYDKNTLCGRIIERLKQNSGRQLNDVVLNLIFLSELVEPLDCQGIDLETLNCAYYESLKLFSDKLIQAKYKIESITSCRIRRKYQEANSYSVLEDTEHLARTCQYPVGNYSHASSGDRNGESLPFTFETFKNDKYH